MHKQQIVAVAAQQDLFCPPSTSKELRRNTTKCNPNSKETAVSECVGIWATCGDNGGISKMKLFLF